MNSLIAFTVAYVFAALVVNILSKTRIRRLLLMLLRLAIILAAGYLVFEFLTGYEASAYSRILSEAWGDIPAEANAVLLGLLAGNIFPRPWRRSRPPKGDSAAIVLIAVGLALAVFVQPVAAASDKSPTNQALSGLQPFDLSPAQLRTLVSSNQIMFARVKDNTYELLCRCGPKITYADLPKYAIEALVATEDKRFYDHHGFDVVGTLRAMFRYNPFSRRREGGSTITQQLVKNTMMDPGDGIFRKWDEKGLAELLETKMPKDEIVTAYFNQAGFGNSRQGRMIVGLEQAARFYYGRSAKSLNLYECAVLVGMLKAPFTYNPVSNPEKAHRRAGVVLALMVDQGKISARQAERALRSGSRSRGEDEAVWVETRNFTDWVMIDIKRRFPDFQPDTRTHIPITLQIMPQFRAETMIKKDLDRAGLKEVEAAYLAMGFDGSVKVMVGQRDFMRHKVNFATQTIRQPASTFKPIVFAAALRMGKLKVDETTKHLLAVSNNEFARRVFAAVGAKAVVKMAKELGIRSKLHPVPSLALGTSEVRLIEMVRAYAPFANRGRSPEPFGYWGVVSSGEALTWRRPVLLQVISEKVAAGMEELLRAVVIDEDGTARAARYVPDAFGKTGTSSGPRDAWFIGSTGNRVSGIWIGRPDSRALSDEINGHFAADVWADIELILTK